MAGVGQPSAGISQLIEEGLDHSINGRQSLCRCVLQKSRNEVDGVVGRFAEHLDMISRWLRTHTLETYFIEWMWLDLRELMFHIVRVHCPNLIPGWSSKHFDDLYQLIDTRFAREKWLPKHQLRHDAPGRPDIFLESQCDVSRFDRELYVLTYFRGVVCCYEYQLRSSVIT